MIQLIFSVVLLHTNWFSSICNSSIVSCNDLISSSSSDEPVQRPQRPVATMATSQNLTKKIGKCIWFYTNMVHWKSIGANDCSSAADNCIATHILLYSYQRWIIIIIKKTIYVENVCKTSKINLVDNNWLVKLHPKHIMFRNLRKFLPYVLHSENSVRWFGVALLQSRQLMLSERVSAVFIPEAVI